MAKSKSHKRELARRRGGGFDVTLRWDPGTDSVSVAVEDDQTGEAFEFDVPRTNAIDAFTHPFAYAPKH
jgi:hypothetical protein